MFTVSIKNRILSLCLVSLVGFSSILSVGGDTLTSNTQQVNRIDQVTYPVMNAASLNSPRIPTPLLHLNIRSARERNLFTVEGFLISKTPSSGF